MGQYTLREVQLSNLSFAEEFLDVQQASNFWIQTYVGSKYALAMDW